MKYINEFYKLKISNSSYDDGSQDNKIWICNKIEANSNIKRDLALKAWYRKDKEKIKKIIFSI